MTETLNMRLGNTILMFLSSSSMFLIGSAIGVYWRPSRPMAFAIAVVAAAFTVLHELVSCFMWCSLTAWWIGKHQRSGTLR